MINDHGWESQISRTNLLGSFLTQHRIFYDTLSQLPTQCTIYQKRYSTISHRYNLGARLLWPQHEKSSTCIYMHNICHKTNTNRLILILTLWVSLIQFLKLWFQKLVNFRKPYDRMLQVASGQKWKDIRSTLSPTFSAAKMKQAS